MKKSMSVFVLALVALTFFQCKSDEEVVDCICTADFSPVCGDDGKLYDNACKAECAGVKYTDGYCPEERSGIVLDLGDPALDGCGWVIQFDFVDEAINFRPSNLPADKKVNGLNVKVNYTLTLTNSLCGMIDQIQVIEINSIEIL